VKRGGSISSKSFEARELCIPRAELLGVVRDAVSVVEIPIQLPMESLVDGKPCPPKAILTLLTYCYALSLYGSRQIEGRLRADQTLCSIADKCQPDHQLIAKFRHRHRELIHQSLRRAYWFIWVKYSVVHANFVLRVDGCQAKAVNLSARPLLSDKIRTEASECIARSAFEDQMMSDHDL
jgi:hypothetical protein